MPSAYAHYRFGRDVLTGLDENTRRVIAANRQLFDIGLTGPDLLFYYRPLRSNAVNARGFSVHARSAGRFVRASGEVIKRYGFDGEYLAYIYGFICHFALDRACHGYINACAAAGNSAHAEIETDFDRALMRRDGSFSCGCIRPSKRSAYIICSFWEGVTAKQIYRAERTYAAASGLLSAIFYLQHLADRLICRIIGAKCVGRLRKSDMVLMKKYSSAIDGARELINEYHLSVTRRLPWNSLYGYTFGGKHIL